MITFERKRMAVEVFDIAMSKEITDAVDTSLKKWKALLLELRELRKTTSLEPIIHSSLQPRLQQTYTSLHSTRAWLGQMQEQRNRRNVAQQT